MGRVGEGLPGFHHVDDVISRTLNVPLVGTGWGCLGRAQSSLGESEPRRPPSAAWGLAHSRGLDEEGWVHAALLVLTREDPCSSMASLGRLEAESPVHPPCVSPASGSPHSLDRAPLGTFCWMIGWLSRPLLPWCVPLYLSSGFFST